MSGARALSRLHVFRSLEAHFRNRWGLGLLLIHRTDGATAMTTSDDPLLGPLLSVIESDEHLKAEHEAALAALHDTRDGRLTDHPAGFQMMAVPCPIGGKSGRVAVLPMATTSNHTDKTSTLAETLRDAGMAPTRAKALADKVPAVSRADVVHIAELLRLMAREAALHAEAWSRSERRLDKLRRQGRGQYSRIIGKCLAMQELYSLMDKIVSTDSTVYINGENGTGKELVAREIHEHSRRKDRPFIIQNCSALNDNLLETELFGHIKGAFSGAIRAKDGLFKVADGGTLFLDEVGDTSPAMQVKLLRVLQEGTFMPVGATEPVSVDVRVVAATNRRLQQMVERGDFREDLYYRLNVIGLDIPPLRDRKMDLPLLYEYFLARLKSKSKTPGNRKVLSPEVVKAFWEYDWPGNVRQLENEIERLVVLSGDSPTIGPAFLSPAVRRFAKPGAVEEPTPVREGAVLAGVPSTTRHGRPPASAEGALAYGQWHHHGAGAPPGGAVPGTLWATSTGEGRRCGNVRRRGRQK